MFDVNLGWNSENGIELNFNYKSNKNESDKKKLNKNQEDIKMKQNTVLITINEDADIISNVSETSQAILDRENHITISNADAIPTIVYQFLKATIEELNKIKKPDEDVSINLMHLIELGVSGRKTEDEEKEANFTPFAVPGQEFKLCIKGDNDTEELD